MTMSTPTVLPALEQLLTEGGDARIELSEQGLNKYGCGVSPDAAALAFGSVTASTISATARSAALLVYDRVTAASSTATLYETYRDELELVRQELAQLCGLCALTSTGNDVDLADTDIVFAASGTDLHLIAAQLLATSPAGSTDTSDASDATDTAMLVIMVEPGETGSSVPAALRGQHFSQRSALGEHVVAGQLVAGSKSIELATVAIRHDDGTARSLAEMDADVMALAHAALARQRQVMLVLADVTKTGMSGPSIDLAIRLRQQYPDQFTVLVDACQFRIANASLHGYLRQGFMVAVTGSKFVSGPSFSGALFIPGSIGRKLRHRPLPEALLAYSSRADWPLHWSGADNLRRQPNLGLLLRWVAALAELRAFRQVPDTAIANYILAFQHAVETYFAGQDRLILIPFVAPDRSALGVKKDVKKDVLERGTPAWDQLPTIYTFLLKGASARQVLSREQTLQVYRQLQQDKKIQLGQPVTCGTFQQIPVSALRLCLSTRLIVAATSGKGGQAGKVIQDALTVLNAAADLAATFA